MNPLRTLISNPTPVPPQVTVRGPAVFQNRWHQAPRPEPDRMGRYVYDTYMQPPLSVIGAASPVPNATKFKPMGAPPMFAETGLVRPVGMPTVAGQFTGTPLSRKPGT